MTIALAATAPKKDAYDIKPEKTTDATPTGVEWQKKNDAALAAATKPETLRTFLASDAAADALLARIGSAYAGDPLVLTQIAGVTQLVMNPAEKSGVLRARWIAALERAQKAATDDYVRTFCRQQLDVCR